MILFLIRTSGSGGDVVLKQFLSRVLFVILFSRVEPILADDIMRNGSVKLFEFGPVVQEKM